MRNPSILLLSFCFLQVAGKSQITPKDVKINPTIKINPAVLDNTSPLRQINLFKSFYILDPGGRSIWAANMRSEKVVMVDCFLDDKNLRWDFISNGDGTYTINSQFDPNKKLVYEKSNIRLPGATGISGSPSGQNGFYVRQNTANTT